MIESVLPEIDGGRFPITRTPGELVTVSADIFADGHDVVDAALQYRRDGDADWQYEPMQLVTNDRWEAQFRLGSMGIYFYTLRGWVDRFKTWARDLGKKADAGQDVSLELKTGVKLLAAAAERASSADLKMLNALSARLERIAGTDAAAAVTFSEDEDLILLISRYRDRAGDTVYKKELVVRVDRARARFSAWYEMFPRSCTTSAEQPGTLRDCAEYVEYVADMGFDVLYLPPIHPIGKTERKGKNNSTTPTPADPGSPWAIGSKDGGHKAINPELGTVADLRGLRAKAELHGVELALDIAFQCSPDHPYVKEHREWFRSRADGSVQYAENPPKKYQDIYPLDFETANYEALAEELKSVIFFWISQGIKIFRVDNPHTKPFAFWEWLIRETQREYPEVIFLAEAFTRPKVMYRLAKLGFTQSYTYFAWKNTKAELTEYFTEITEPPVSDFFRPNLWPNTPDILNEYLQKGGRSAFIARLVLAATLGANYGIYGPAFELMENVPVREGSEEYLDSEKYQVRVWNRNDPKSLKGLIRRVNSIRRDHVALQDNYGLTFHLTDNPQLIAYSKTSEDRGDKLLVVVNLDPVNRQMGWVDVALKEFRLAAEESYEVNDLLTDKKYIWQGSRNYVELNPAVLPAHIFRVEPLR
ncbi:MAG TPA: alpha-1,4-glucan--maltose-1-phosphate maltosyltransferase [Candidatus Acidoferrum sp.]|nr:alpha-1,4-glucan--maltose-1-phosphate maltosyltransferase [Candidatus Acidoferrum sp.]